MTMPVFLRLHSFAARLGMLSLLAGLLLLLDGCRTRSLTADAGDPAAGRTAAFSVSIRGLNWADTRDNFQKGVIYLSGLGPSDTYASAATVADKIVGQMYALTGGNTVRMPVNEATVSDYWGTYTGAIDAALKKGNVILCYWAVKDGKPADRAAFKTMWMTIVGRYGANPNAYFEPINEPHGFSPADLNDFYHDWLSTFPKIPRGRVILDGSRYAERPVTVGGDHRLDGCLLGYHEYAFFHSFPDEAAWLRHIRDDIGEYHARTVCTEFGAEMNTPVPKEAGGGWLPDYSVHSTHKPVIYLRTLTGQFRAWGMGSVYWPGVRDNDGYRLCTRSGNGAGTILSVNNSSGLARIRYGWGADTPVPPQYDRPVSPEKGSASVPVPKH